MPAFLQPPAATEAPAPPPCSELPCFALPEKFDGSANRCQGFLRQGNNFFVQQPEVYSCKTIRCAFLLPLLTGKVMDWASAVWDSDPQVQLFHESHQKSLRVPGWGKGHFTSVARVTSGADTAADFAIKFCMLAAQSGLNKTALVAVFREGVNPDLKAEMACWETNVTLSQYTTIWLDLQPPHHVPCLTA